MDNRGDLSIKEPERIFISPPALKRLTSHKMALVLWRHIVHNSRKNNKLDCDWFHNNDFYSENIIEIDPVLAEMINACVWDPVAVSIVKWCDYHENYVFFDCSLHDAILNCIDEFVLHPDGSVNFQSTAKNILVDDKLNLVEKYRLACISCLADDVKSIWPLVRDDPRVTECTQKKNPLVHYWTCVMKGESPRLPGADSDSFENVVDVIVYLEWTAVEYFWNVLSADEQITVAKRLLYLLDNDDAKFVPLLFLKLNKTQFQEVMEGIPVGNRLFLNFFDEPSKYPEMLEIWNNIKYFISLVKFREIIDAFIQYGFDCEQPNLLCSLLFEIWTSAPDRLRHSFLNDREAVESIFRELHLEKSRFVRIPKNNFDMRFFIAVFTELSFQSRNALWCNFWRKLIIGTAPKCLDHMMKLCFNNDDEITQFKERHMMNFDKIHDFCYRSMLTERISELNEFLNFCSSNVHFVASVKRQIIASSKVQSAFLSGNLSCEKFIGFDKFIDSAFFDENDARNYKKKLMKSSKEVRIAYAKIHNAELGVSWV